MSALKQYKEIYQQNAKLISNAKEIPQIELADLATSDNPLADNYLAVLVVRYWNIIEKLVYKDHGLYDEKEAYDWYMDSLLYILRDKPWNDPKTSVYKDERAVEKMLNTCVKCARANWFQASNRQKRKINHGLGSIEALSEEFNDAFLPADLTTEMSVGFHKELVIDYFNKQQYILAVMLDVIVNDIKLDALSDDRSLVNQIKRSIKALPDTYSEIFAESYNLDPEVVGKSFVYIYNMSDTKLKQTIESYLFQLRMLLKREYR